MLNNLSKRLDYFENDDNGNDNNNGDNTVQYWKGKKIIPLSEWKKIADYSEYASHGLDRLRMDRALQYFPDQYNEYLFVFDVPEAYLEKANQWYSDYRELHEHILISKYGLDTYKKMIEEAYYHDMKKTWYFHDSSWYMRGANGYDDKGCNDYTGCVPECDYFKPSLYPELLPLLKGCEDNRQLLARSCLADQQN